MKKIMIVLAAVLISTSILQAGVLFPGGDITGIWLGKVRVTDQLELSIGFVIRRSDAGELKASLNVIEQKAFDIPMDHAVLSHDTLTVALQKAGISFTGICSSDGSRIDGTFAQSGKSYPLVLMPVGELPKTVSRPQTPVRPFPYAEEEVQFENRDAGITLSGTLTYPRGEGARPAVILIAGSGRNDRNGSKMGHFLLLSDYLTRKGFVVLRSDKRGVGRSGGDYYAATTADFASDIAAATDFLKTRPEVDSRRIGLIGHSEGSLIAPIVVSNRKGIAFIVLLGAAGLPGDDLLLLQTRKLSAASGADSAAIEEQVRQFRSYYAAIHENISRDSCIGKLHEINPEISDGMVNMLTRPWIAWFTACNPADYLAKVKCPVLVLNGGTDLQCPPEENFDAIRKALKKARNRDVTMKVLPGLNHMLQTSPSGSPLEYEKIEEIIAPAALDEVGKWLEGRI